MSDSKSVACDLFSIPGSLKPYAESEPPVAPAIAAVVVAVLLLPSNNSSDN